MFQDKLDRIRLFFRKEKEPYLQLRSILGFYPHNISLYNEALLHKSYLRQQGDKSNKRNNERLEYLGDAVLETVVSDILYKQYPNRHEGFLTTLRSKLVRRDTLNKLAVQTGLNKFIKHTGPVTSAHNSYMNGNAFEALIGAIYLDRGFPYCMRFMKEKVFSGLIDIDKVANTEENFKSRLIEWCQKYQLTFAFETESLLAKDNHTPLFVSKVLVQGVECGTGKGYSKKESQQKAAKASMALINRDKAFSASLIGKKSNE